MAALPDVLPAGPVELRRCRLDDLDDLMSAIELSQPELARWLPWADPMPTKGAEELFLRDRVAAFDADKEFLYFLIEPASDGLVGGAGVHPKDGGFVEIGYWVRSDRTQRGYATAAAGALTTAVFEYLPGVERVIIRMDQGNLASASVPPKLGFHLDGEEAFRDVVTAGHTGKGWIWSRTVPPEKHSHPASEPLPPASAGRSLGPAGRRTRK